MIDCIPHMADVAQLVRASVCGTECRRFESGHPPHEKLNTPTAWFIFYLGGSDENRRFDTIVDKNKPSAVRVLRVEPRFTKLPFGAVFCLEF